MYSTGSRGLFEPTALDSFIEQNSPFKQSQPPWEVDRNDRSNFMSPVHDFGKKGQSFDSWQEQQASQLARNAGSFDIRVRAPIKLIFAIYTKGQVCRITKDLLRR